MLLVLNRAIDGQQLRWNHALYNTHRLGCEEEHTMLFLECSAEKYSRVHYCKNRGIATHNGDHSVRKVTQLTHFRFSSWASIVSCNALLKKKRPNSGGNSSLLKVKQRLKPTAAIQENHSRSSIQNARSGRRGFFNPFGTTCPGGVCDGECFLCVLEPIRTEGI